MSTPPRPYDPRRSGRPGPPLPAGRPQRRPAGPPPRRPSGPPRQSRPGRPVRPARPAERSRSLSLANVDPYCLVAVVPMVLVAVVGVWSGFLLLTLIFGLLAVLVLLGDAWINRP
jgi:hypothetical protein